MAEIKPVLVFSRYLAIEGMLITDIKTKYASNPGGLLSSDTLD